MEESRWQKTKAKSKWHFDDVYKNEKQFFEVCTFKGEWVDSIKNCAAKAEDNTWLEKVGGGMVCQYGDEEAKYCAADYGAVNDIKKAGGDPDVKMYARAKADDEEPFKKITEHFGLAQCNTWFQTQKSGQMAHLHIDQLGKAGREQGDKKNFRRFIVMLDDWQPGQTFLFGNQYWIWKKGQCVTWNYKDIPHGTANFSYQDRPMLQITGLETEKTKEIIASGSYKNIVNIV